MPSKSARFSNASRTHSARTNGAILSGAREARAVEGLSGAREARAVEGLSEGAVILSGGAKRRSRRSRNRKSARRFFVEGVQRSGAGVEIGGGDARKIRRVLRLRDGDEIEVVDSAGISFAAAIAIEGAVVRATLGAALANETQSETDVQFDVAQAIPKGQKMDFVVEKTTELGAEAILPFRCERSVARAEAGKEERWRRVAAAAAKQCGRRRVPQVHSTLPSFDALLDRFGEYDAVAFAWELAPRVPLRERLPELLRDARRVLLVVGPEGGFTHDEAEAARVGGAVVVWLGPRILRAETAAVALLAVADALAQGRTPGRRR